MSAHDHEYTLLRTGCTLGSGRRSRYSKQDPPGYRLSDGPWTLPQRGVFRRAPFFPPRRASFVYETVAS